MSLAIRDAMLAVVAATFPEIPEARIHSRKMDTTEKFPAASIYLGELDSERASMARHRKRVQEVRVIIFRANTEDLEGVFLGNTDTLEQAVETARRAGDFGEVPIELTNMNMQFPQDGNGKNGAVVMTFSAEYTRALE